jgi:putative endonuclease
MAYYVYVLRGEKDGSFYIGHTADLDERIQRHNRGRSSYTKTKLPWKLIYQEEFLSRSEVMKREMEIKRMKSREYIERLVRASRAGLGKVIPTQGRDGSRKNEKGLALKLTPFFF